MRYELRSIGVWAFVRTSFFIHLVFGFILGLFYAAIFGLIMAVASSLPMDGTSGFDPTTLGPIFIIMLPILFSVGSAVFGTLFTAILVIVYNMIVKMTGGVEFELEATTLDQMAISRPSQGSPTVIPAYAPPPPPPSSMPPAPPTPQNGPSQNPPPAPPKYDWTPPPSSDQPHGPESENR